MASPALIFQPDNAPSQLQIALAVAVLRSKPDGVTVRDYILQLRQHLKRGSQVFSSSDDHHHHLDQVAYWKARHDETMNRCKELEHRNIQLERWRVADEQGLNAIVIDDDGDSRPGTPKRKRAGASKAARKRPKYSSPAVSELSMAGVRGRSGFQDDQDRPSTPGGDRKSVSIIASSDPDEVAKVKETLVQKLYITHKLYKQETVKHEAICFSLVEVARAIGSVVATIPKNYDQLAMGNLKGLTPVEKDRSELSAVILSSTRAWASLVVGLKKLSDGVEIHLPSLVIFECVKMFKTIFDSVSESAHQIAHARSTTPPKGSKSRADAGITPRDTGPFRAIAQFLNAVVASLNKDDRHHREIFEGVLFILMERIGKLLFYYTFDRHRSATIEGDITIPQTRDDKSEVIIQIVEAMATRLEAQCLISILERVIGLAPYHMNNPLASRPGSGSANRRTSSQTRSPTKSLQRASATPLVAHAKERLQRTLIQCMFGDEQRDEFVDVLRMPGALGPLPKVAKLENKDVGEWFNGEVWRLIGWDLLGKEGEW